jgi:glycerophosphoryl diester phosphodiesterase
MMNGWTQLTLEGLVQWMKEHDDVYIVTDIKEENMKLLRIIDDRHPEIKDRIIPQIYYMDELRHAEYHGYENIIYTLYKSSNTEDEIVDFIRYNDLLAVAMPVERLNQDFVEKIKDTGTFIYTHTINDEEQALELEEKGVDGFYTDDIFE